MKKTVSIIQTRLMHYRLPLFGKLKEYLADLGINLNLIHGLTSDTEAKKKDDGYLEWATQVENVTIKFGRTEAVWQPALGFIKDSDLVIVPQENRILLNYLLLARRVINRQKIAFWGHGKNFQNTNPRHPKELFKRIFLNMPDWWFAYTSLTEEILLNAKYPASKITVLENAIDTGELKIFAKSITENTVHSLRNSLGIKGKRVGIFCGSLYHGKRIDILIEAARQIRSRINDFELVVIGAGPDDYLIKEAVKESPWIHYVGPRFGYEKVLFIKLGQVFLLPYIVGLAILDSFAIGLPLITMGNGSHSPEIAYLKNNVNGIITQNSFDALVEASVGLLNDPKRIKTMSEQCLKDSDHYTVENMVNNFAGGIVTCLEME